MARSSATDFDLEQAVPYLLARTGARMGGAFAKAIKPSGLSLVEWRVCASLNHRPGQTLSQLSLNASVDISALSRLIDRLIAQGQVERQRSDQDARALHLLLTKEGKRLTNSLVPLARRYEDTAVAGFTEAEIVQLRDMLHRIYANADTLL